MTIFDRKLPNVLHRLALAILAQIICAFPVATWSQVPPSIPTCYEYIGRGHEEPPLGEELFVLIDQTVGFDKQIIPVIKQKIADWSKPGKRVSIIRFASNIGNRSVSGIFSVRLSPYGEESWKDWLKRSARSRFERCERDQPREALRRSLYAVEHALIESERLIPKSDIIFSLQRTSEIIRASNAKKKYVLVISDMLENSSSITFYSRGRILVIDPAKTMSTVSKLGLISNFGGAKIFVYGTGYVAPVRGEKPYIGPKRMKPLVRFWTEYFSLSNSIVGEIGSPVLLGRID